MAGPLLPVTIVGVELVAVPALGPPHSHVSRVPRPDATRRWDFLVHTWGGKRFRCSESLLRIVPSAVHRLCTALRTRPAATIHRLSRGSSTGLFVRPPQPS